MRKVILSILIIIMLLFSCQGPAQSPEPPDPLNTLIPQAETELETSDYNSLIPNPVCFAEQETTFGSVTIIEYGIDYNINDISFVSVSLVIENIAENQFSVAVHLSNVSASYSCNYIIFGSSYSAPGTIENDLVTISMDVLISDTDTAISNVDSNTDSFTMDMDPLLEVVTAYFGLDLLDQSVPIINNIFSDISVDVIYNVFEEHREDLLK